MQSGLPLGTDESPVVGSGYHCGGGFATAVVPLGVDRMQEVSRNSKGIYM